MTSSALKVECLSKEIDNKYLVKNLSFEIPVGQKVLLLGHNGAGKSTLLKIFAGLMRASEGSVSIPSNSIAFQGHQLALYDDLSLAENLSFFLSINVSNLNQIIKTWGLDDCKDRALNSCSQGEKYRTALACTLAQDPALCLLDEPSTALDAETLSVLTQNISSAVGKTFLIASHDFTSFAPSCDRLLILKAGSLVHDSLLDSISEADRGQHVNDIYLEYRA